MPFDLTAYFFEKIILEPFREKDIDIHAIATRYLQFFGHEVHSNIDAIDIPSSDPVIFVFNHPYGLLDVAALFTLLKKIRPDIKVMTNAVLTKLQKIRSDILPVNFDGTAKAKLENLETLLRARDHLLNDNGVLMMAPSGMIATRPLSNLFKASTAEEGRWSEGLGMIAARSRPTIIPVFIAGENSSVFHAASHISTSLRTLSMFWENLASRKEKIQIILGEPLSAEEYLHQGDGKMSYQDVSDFLCEQTLRLKEKARAALTRKHLG